MLYSEFVEGTGCKDNEKNYKVYKDLEIMYMNSDMSKAEIYEYGKKLVDNSKSEKELQFEAEINAEIEKAEAEIKDYKEWKEYYKEQKEYSKSIGDKTMERINKGSERYYADQVKAARRKIAELKWVLA